MVESTPGTTIVELADGVFARLHEGLTNAGIIVGDDGVLVIDSLRVPSFARDLIADVKRLTPKPIRWVVDTHSHWDHAWGNEEFPDATIIGHDNARAEMLDVDLVEWWRERAATSGMPWSDEAKTVQVTPPSLTFDESMRLFLGNRELHLRLVCAMARIDGAFVGSELGVALEVADRLAGDCPGRRKRYRALVRELFISPTALPDPVSQLAALPRHEALDVVESLKAMAWADGLLRAAEHRMLCLVHDALDLPRELVGALRCSPRYVDPLAA